MSGPLEGIRVVEFAHLFSTPALAYSAASRGAQEPALDAPLTLPSGSDYAWPRPPTIQVAAGEQARRPLG